MSYSSLALWLLIERWAVVFGLLAALLLYIGVRPRPQPAWHEVGAEGWRIMAILASIPAFALGAELALWAGLLDHRAPLAFTGFAHSVAWALLFLTPVPIVRRLVYKARPTARDVGAGALLVSVAAVLMGSGPDVRAAAYTSLAEQAADNPSALHELVNLKTHRYLSFEEIDPVLQYALPTGAAVLAFVDDARRSGDPTLDGELQRALASRLVVAAQAGQVDETAVAAVWWLRGTTDPSATLDAYAGAAAFRLIGGSSERAAMQQVVTHALNMGTDEAAEVVLRAAYPALATAPLAPELAGALAERANSDRTDGLGDELARLAMLALLRDASSASLRPIAPRFADPDAEEWSLLLDECPRATAGLDRLSDDADAAVAEGARRLRAYVRQYCADWYQGS